MLLLPWPGAVSEAGPAPRPTTEHDSTTPPADHEPGLAITPPDEMPRDGDEPRTPTLRREAARPYAYASRRSVSGGGAGWVGGGAGGV